MATIAGKLKLTPPSIKPSHLDKTDSKEKIKVPIKRKTIEAKINFIPKVDSSDVMYTFFKDPVQVKKLIQLYQDSQMENSKNGKITADIGIPREKDLVAFLKTNSNLQVDYDINGLDKPDCIIDGRITSIKHSSNKKVSKSGIKEIWTANEAKQLAFLKNKDHFSNDLLIVWVRFEKNIHNGELEIIHIPRENIRRIHHLFQIEKKDVFHRLCNNSRGIEYKPEFFTTIIKNCKYHAVISFQDVITIHTDPIMRRLKVLETPR